MAIISELLSRLGGGSEETPVGASETARSGRSFEDILRRVDVRSPPAPAPTPVAFQRVEIHPGDGRANGPSATYGIAQMLPPAHGPDDVRASVAAARDEGPSEPGSFVDIET